jgi:hypothetical protein
LIEPLQDQPQTASALRVWQRANWLWCNTVTGGLHRPLGKWLVPGPQLWRVWPFYFDPDTQTLWSKTGEGFNVHSWTLPGLYAIEYQQEQWSNHYSVLESVNRSFISADFKNITLGELLGRGGCKDGISSGGSSISSKFVEYWHSIIWLIKLLQVKTNKSRSSFFLFACLFVVVINTKRLYYCNRI